jgi:hypothetical protein
MKNLFFLFCFLLIAGAAYSQQLQVSASTTSSCMDDGTATCTVTGGVPPYQFEWTKPGDPTFPTLFTQSISNLKPGVYQLIVTDANGDFTYGMVYVNPIVLATINTTPDTCLLGKGTATVNAISGTPPYTYLWSTGATTGSVSGLPFGNVTVTVTDATGCFLNTSDLDSAGVGNPVGYTSTFQISFSVTNANCLNGTATANVTGGVAPYSYSWNTSPVQNTVTAVNLTANETYSVTVTDASGCTGTNDVYIPSNSNLTYILSSTADTCNSANGTLSVSAIAGTPPYTYLWSTGQTITNITNIQGGQMYTISIQDAAGCTILAGIYAPQYSPVSVSFTSTPSDCIVPTGSITANPSGGQPPYTYNWLVNPAQTTATATSLSAGGYSVIVTDQNGCTRQSFGSVNDISTLSVSILTSSPDTCYLGKGQATVTGNAGQPPYTYSWNTNPVQNTASATGLIYGNHKVTVTDASGCVRIKNVPTGNFETVSVAGVVTNASCIYTNDGSVSVNPAGGNPPYSYTWSNGQNTSVASGLLPGYYSVNTQDASGCNVLEIFNVNYVSIQPCAIEIAGKVFADVNSNCTYSWPDIPRQQVPVQCAPSGEYHYTDNAGNFNFVKPATGTYNLDMILPTWYEWSCGPRPAVVTSSVLGTTTIQDLPLTGNALDMVVSSVNLNPAVPGFNFDHIVHYQNQGSLTSFSNTLKVNYDPLLNYLGASSNPATVNTTTGELTFIVSGAAGMSLSNIILHFNLPPSIGIGNQLVFKDSIFTPITDTVLLNNYYTRIEDVVGSFDPNDIQVSPRGAGSPGYIGLTDSILTYTVRFQNTGNYPAQNVVIKLQADADLDLSTLQFLGASFSPSIEIDANGLIIFSFIGIYLPDSVMNEPESHGYLLFSIKQKPNLQPATEISMSADIYFDFNAPVTTNSTLNTITAIEFPDTPSAGLSLFPDPASEYIWMKLPEGTTADKFVMTDIMGRVIRTSQLQKEAIFRMDLHTIPAGVYLISTYNGNEVITQKFIKQ